MDAQTFVKCCVTMASLKTIKVCMGSQLNYFFKKGNSGVNSVNGKSSRLAKMGLKCE